jgi:hypothetical protein
MSFDASAARPSALRNLSLDLYAKQAEAAQFQYWDEPDPVLKQKQTNDLSLTNESRLPKSCYFLSAHYYGC